MKRNNPNETSIDRTRENQKKIFIFTPRPDALASAQAFLRNRGWIVQTAHDLRDGVADCLGTKPDFVLLCADHTNQSVRSLPKLLQQALSARLILFADSNTVLMTALADEIDCPYTLYPPASGPAIERAIWRVQRDERRINKGSESAIHRVSGSQAIDASDSVAYRPTHGPRSEDHDQDVLVSLHKQEARSDASSRNAHRETTSRFAQEEPTTRTSDAYMGRTAAKPIGQGEAGGWARLTEDRDSILVTGTDVALAEVGENFKSGSPTNLPLKIVDVVSRIGCIDVESPRFSGYLLMALGADRALDEGMMETMRARLVEFMHEHGEPFEVIDAVGVQVVDVTFETWAIKQADFLRKSVHDGHELAVAFFPKKAQPLKLEPSARADMVRVTIDDLQGDAPVEFDVYLHLPMNDKYILYTPEGAHFYQLQKDRLKKKGVASFHLKKQSAVDLRRYRIQNFLNQLIGEIATESAT